MAIRIPKFNPIAKVSGLKGFQGCGPIAQGLANGMWLLAAECWVACIEDGCSCCLPDADIHPGKQFAHILAGARETPQADIWKVMQHVLLQHSTYCRVQQTPRIALLLHWSRACLPTQAVKQHFPMQHL